MLWFVYEFVFILTVVSGFFLSPKPKLNPKKIHQRLKFFDTLKGIAIISIIGIHASDLISLPVLKDILWYALAIFVIESGYLLNLRHKKIEWKKYLKSIFKRIVIVYALFTISYHIIDNQGIVFFELILDLLLGRSNGNFYFIPILIQLYLIFPLIKRFNSKRFVFISLVISFVFYVADHLVQQPAWNQNPWMLAFAGRYLFFFAFGMYLSKYDMDRLEFKHTWPTVFIYFAGLVPFSVMAGKPYFTYIYGSIAFLLFFIMHNRFKIPYKLSILIQDIGKYSLVIYLFHTRLIYNLPWNLDFQPGILYVSVVFSVLMVSYLFSVYFTKILRRITG